MAVWSTTEWSIENADFEGNPFDVIAKVDFRHTDSGEIRTTEMFYAGENQWRYRFTGTRPGRWSFLSRCDGTRGTSLDPELEGLTGIITVTPTPEGLDHGFITNIGFKWGWSGSGNVFVPQYVMGKDLDAYYDRKAEQVDEDRIDRDIQEFIVEHGFTGFHLRGWGRWFNLTGKPGKDPNPDPRTYEVMEDIIRKVYRRGGACHIWMWGSDGKTGGEGPRWLIDGPMNGSDKRNLRYLAARLGPLPGWTMGYGFDTENLWASPEELDAWKAFLEERMGWDHFLGSRVGYDEKGLWGRYGDRSKAPLNAKHNAPIGDEYCTWLGGDYIGYTSYRPLYDRYVEVIDHRPDMPSFDEDRFRLRKAKQWTHKDYSQELTIKGLWHSAMAGGVANIWGNLLPDDNQGGSHSYDHGDVRIKHLIKTYATFFRDKGRFRSDFIRDNSLADQHTGTTEIPEPVPISVCLRNPSRTHFIFYTEDAKAVAMDLSAMNGPQPAVAVDTKQAYQEIDLGILRPDKQHWQAPYESTWAIAVGACDVKTLSGPATVRCETDDPAVALAVDDLLIDLQRVLGKSAELVGSNESADIVVRIDSKLGGPERWIRDVSGNLITITGSDALGAIYGVYEFCRAELDVDPLWFWKDLPPKPRESVEVPVKRTESVEPIFRYRGWFVNDEDLLTEWKQPSGKRFIRYPFYDQVISLDVADRIFEALLRTGGNMIIPASFIDVMNPPEAALVRRAAERGLYVTQHHIEPLGVSHFGFENYWQQKGQNRSFSYGSDPDSVRHVWKAHAEKWVELAGDRVIWQLGLRGKGDTAIWNSDKSVSRVEAGRFISRAIAEQWQIARIADPRPAPPATATLWLEGSQLMSAGSLTFPEDVTIVFADEGKTQHMQQDFHNTARQDGREYGVYYHVGFWASGPHLLQGTPPYRVEKVFDQIIAKGDTDYAVINVCNIREHVMGIQAAMAAMHGPWDHQEFLHQWSPQCLHEAYRLLMDSFISVDSDRILQDGAIFMAIRRHITALAEGKPAPAGKPASVFEDAIAKLDRIIAEYPTDEIPSRMRQFYDIHLLTQAKMWRGLLRCLHALKLAHDDPTHIARAETALEDFLTVRKRAASGRWENWYRGDKKVNTLAILRQLRSLQARQAGTNVRQ